MNTLSLDTGLTLSQHTLITKIEEAKHEFNKALSELEATAHLLMEKANLANETYYANSILQKKVGKKNFLKQTMDNIAREKNLINCFIKANMDVISKTRMVAITQLAEIDDQIQRLRMSLEKWQSGKIVERQQFEAATHKFKEIKKIIKKNDKPMDPLKLQELYLPFLEKYKKVKLINLNKEFGYFEDCESTVPLPKKVIEALVSSKKSFPELKALVELTKDKKLCEEAETIAGKISNYAQNQNTLSCEVRASIKCLDMIKHEKLILSATSLANEYFVCGDELLKESKKAQETIQAEEEKLLIDLQKAGLPEGFVHQQRRNFSEALKQMRNAEKVWTYEKNKAIKNGGNRAIANPVVTTAHDDFKTTRDCLMAEYKIFNAAIEKGKKVCSFAYSKKYEISKQYQEVSKRYALAQPARAVEFQLQVSPAIKMLEDAIDMAEAVVKKNKDEVVEYQSRLLQAKLVEMIRSAVKENVTFWNRQVSVFGSRGEINGVKVPLGIQQFFIDLKFSDMYTDEKLLQIFQANLLKRKNAGTGFFAKRAEHTTDKFYDLVLKVDVVNLTAERLKAFETDLRKIKDSHGSLLSPSKHFQQADAVHLTLR